MADLAEKIARLIRNLAMAEAGRDDFPAEREEALVHALRDAGIGAPPEHGASYPLVVHDDCAPPEAPEERPEVPVLPDCPGCGDSDETYPHPGGGFGCYRCSRRWGAHTAELAEALDRKAVVAEAPEERQREAEPLERVKAWLDALQVEVRHRGGMPMAPDIQEELLCRLVAAALNGEADGGDTPSRQRAAHVVTKSRTGGSRDEPPHHYAVLPRRETREEALADLARWEEGQQDAFPPAAPPADERLREAARPFRDAIVALDEHEDFDDLPTLADWRRLRIAFDAASLRHLDGEPCDCPVEPDAAPVAAPPVETVGAPPEGEQPFRVKQDGGEPCIFAFDRYMFGAKTDPVNIAARLNRLFGRLFAARPAAVPAPPAMSEEVRDDKPFRWMLTDSSGMETVHPSAPILMPKDHAAGWRLTALYAAAPAAVEVKPGSPRAVLLRDLLLAVEEGKGPLFDQITSQRAYSALKRITDYADALAALDRRTREAPR